MCVIYAELIVRVSIKNLSLFKYEVCGGLSILNKLEEMMILYHYSFRYRGFMSIRDTYSPPLKMFCLMIFDFTMVKSDFFYTFSRNCSWNFEF